MIPSFNIPACHRLIKRAFILCELSPLIEAVFSSKDEGDLVRCLRGEDAQTFIDVLYEVCSTLITKSGQFKLTSTRSVE